LAEAVKNSLELKTLWVCLLYGNNT